MAVNYVLIDYNMQPGTAITDKIAKIDIIIDSLYNVALLSVAQGDTMEYTLDTGQTKVSKKYTSPKEVTDAITAYERIRQMLVNKIQSRVVRLIDSKNFRR